MGGVVPENAAFLQMKSPGRADGLCGVPQRLLGHVNPDFAGCGNVASGTGVVRSVIQVD